MSVTNRNWHVLPQDAAHTGAPRRYTLQQHLAMCRNDLYVTCERALGEIYCRKSVRILVSEKKRDWQDAIALGFGGTHHQVMFGVIGPDSLQHCDLVLPLEIEGLIQARQWPELVRKNPIPIPTKESVLLCDDKYVFNEILTDRGFGDCIPRMGTHLRPPYILKKRIGYWGQQCWLVRKEDDEASVADLLSDPDFYRQRIVRGRREFATHILFAQDKIVKSLNIMYEFDSDTPIKGQDRSLYRVICRCPYLRQFAKILRAIGFEGLCCVNYKVAGGRPCILEINPRFGASLAPYFFSFIRCLKFD